MGKDKHKDGETTASSETNRDHNQDQEARDATLAQKGTTNLPTSLKISSGSHSFKVMDPFNWTNLFTRDGNYGQKRLDLPLMPWREIQRKPRFLTSIIGSMEKE